MKVSIEPDNNCSAAEPVALQVLGIDMAPEFPDGCIIIFEQKTEYQPGMYVIAEVNGERWFRQYQRDHHDQAWLVALNPMFPDIPLAGLNWKILGVVTQRNIKRQVKHYNY